MDFLFEENKELTLDADECLSVSSMKAQFGMSAIVTYQESFLV